MRHNGYLVFLKFRRNINFKYWSFFTANCFKAKIWSNHTSTYVAYTSRSENSAWRNNRPANFPATKFTLKLSLMVNKSSCCSGADSRWVNFQGTVESIAGSILRQYLKLSKIIHTHHLCYICPLSIAVIATTVRTIALLTYKSDLTCFMLTMVQWACFLKGHYYCSE